MAERLKTFTDVIRELSEKYDIPFEIVESIIMDYVSILYHSISPTEGLDLFNFEG